jgi:hypothetical protein
MRGGKSFLLLLIVALGVGGYAWFVERKADPSDAAAKHDKVFTVESEKIDEITVKAATGEQTKLKREGGAWKIVAPAALTPDLAEVSAMTTALAGVEMDKTVEDNAASLANYTLEPARISVNFHIEGGASHTLDLGVKTPNGADLYARADGGKKVFLVGAYREDALNKTTFNLRDKTVLTFDRDKADYLKIDDGKKPVAMAKAATAQWKLTEPITGGADFTAVDGIVGRLYQLKMKSLVAEDGSADLKKYGLDKPQYTVTLGAGSARSTLVIGGKAEDGSVYARELTRPMVFTLESTLADDLKKPASDYRQKDVFEFRAFTAKRVEITRGGETYAFALATAGSDSKPAEWKLEKPVAKALDATKANDMLGNFSNLRADSFVDAAGAGPETTVTATFGEGTASRTETVTFREVPAKATGKGAKDKEAVPATVHAVRKGEKGAMVISALDFDKAMAIFKELTGSK